MLLATRLGTRTFYYYSTQTRLEVKKHYSQGPADKTVVVIALVLIAQVLATLLLIVLALVALTALVLIALVLIALMLVALVMSSSGADFMSDNIIYCAK